MIVNQIQSKELSSGVCVVLGRSDLATGYNLSKALALGFLNVDSLLLSW